MWEVVAGKWLAGKLLNCAWGRIKAAAKRPEILEAFEKACQKAAKENPSLFSNYTAASLNISETEAGRGDLAVRLQELFGTANFPTPDELAELLLESWRLRKATLKPEEAAPLFREPEETAKKFLRRLAELFFHELSQVGSLRDPYLIRALQDMSANPIQLNALHQLPPPPGDFVGREEELEELRKAIEQGGATISGLTGQGGVGKTALALKLADGLTGKFPDAQIYLDLKGVSDKPLTPGEAMGHVIRAFHPERKIPEAEQELSGVYRSVLHEKKALLLMDNARDAAQVRPLIPQSGCAMLVTSRQHFTLPGLKSKNLDVLPAGESKKLLLEIAPRIESEAEAIAKLCGYLPQALRLAGSALQERVDLSPAEYARRLEDEKQRLKLLTGEDESVEASISLSYELLDEGTQKRWRTLGVFPDTFDAQAAAAVWGIEGSSASVPAGDKGRRDGGATGDTAKDTLSRLVQYSMLEWNEATKRYRLHDLMRDFARGRIGEDEREEASARHSLHYVQVLRFAEHLYLKGGDPLMDGLALLDLEWGNIQAGQAWAAVHASKNRETAWLCSAFPGVGPNCLSLRQHPRERIRWLEPALAAARQLSNRTAEEACLGELGIAFRRLGETRRAISFFLQALRIAREIGDWRDEGTALGNLGNAYADLGETRRAIQYLFQHLHISRKGGDRRGEGGVLGNLGIAYKNLGETRRAIEYFEQNLAIACEIGDRWGESNALVNLGVAHSLLGEAGRAIEYYEKALAIDREIGDRRGEGSVLGNLGIAHSLLGETGRAIELYKQAVAINREIGNPRGAAGTSWNMSLALDKLGERKKAIEHAEAALEIYEQIEDPNAEKVRKKIEEWKKGSG